MTELNLAPNIQDPDDVYQMLVDMHSGRSVDDSLKISSKLILILANHIGDVELISKAIALAKGEQSQ